MAIRSSRSPLSRYKSHNTASTSRSSVSRRLGSRRERMPSSPRPSSRSGPGGVFAFGGGAGSCSGGGRGELFLSGGRSCSGR
ncbi:MAG: hypothetical protein E7442_05645 [Ruminococcaceae bacterium]|nr:hypothetical protein [Oscillospiraceae bacterium]